jgi:hypothetical protein
MIFLRVASILFKTGRSQRALAALTLFVRQTNRYPARPRADALGIEEANRCGLKGRETVEVFECASVPRHGPSAESGSPTVPRNGPIIPRFGPSAGAGGPTVPRSRPAIPQNGPTLPR